MAIKPILFNTEMARAILDGRKTCTRRLVKFLPGENSQWTGYIKDGLMLYNGRNEPCIRKAPYQLGDILYVRETWSLRYDGEKYFYKADKNTPREEKRLIDYNHTSWRPSIHMPKEAARIWLKVTDVRVERLQDMTDDDAEAEGMPDSLDYPVNKAYCPLCKGEGIIGTVDVHSLGHMDVDCPYCDSYRKRFENLWNSINQKSLDSYGWDANPWVWVIEFERCEKPQEV